jgi:two-component system, NarL family, invasion response regulator UvrY
MLRIFLVDDNAKVRSSLRAVLEQQAEWFVVGEAVNGRDALKTFDNYKPNVTVMDYSMPEMNGLEAARHLKTRDPSAAILMVTANPTIQLQREAKKTGINGFCPKDEVSCLLIAIKALARGRTYFHFREPVQAVA